MLPVVTETTRLTLDKLTAGNIDDWKRRMIHHLKEDNPEVNTLLLELAQKSSDPKSVILAGYMVYQALELALNEEEETTSQLLG